MQLPMKLNILPFPPPPPSTITTDKMRSNKKRIRSESNENVNVCCAKRNRSLISCNFCETNKIPAQAIVQCRKNTIKSSLLEVKNMIHNSSKDDIVTKNQNPIFEISVLLLIVVFNLPSFILNGFFALYLSRSLFFSSLSLSHQSLSRINIVQLLS